MTARKTYGSDLLMEATTDGDAAPVGLGPTA